jgi:osmotically-inducible protein OsmY
MNENQVRTDEHVKTDIVASMKRDTRVDASDVGVEVDQRVVTLKGTVPSYRSMWAAYDDALLTEGVVRVLNLLKVRSRSENGVPTDSQVSESAKKLLAWSADVDSATLSLAVDDGTVTLTGSVPTYSDREAAGEAITFLSGVKDVKNELAVVPTKHFSDQMIATDIIDELERSLFVDPAAIEVKVVDGIVTLTGEVGTSFSSARAERVAKNAWGVKDVNNLLTVKFI